MDARGAGKADLYEQWVQAPDKDTERSALADLIRREWTKGGPTLGAEQEKGHWLDVDVVVEVLVHTPGPKPSLEQIMAIGHELRATDNWRSLTHARNVGIDMECAEAIKTAVGGNRVQLKGHQLAKAQHQAAWLVAHKEELPASFVKQLGKALARVEGTDGKAVLDRRLIKGAGKHYDAANQQALPCVKQVHQREEARKEGKTVLVQGYEKADGTKVAPHYRAPPSPASPKSPESTTQTVNGYTKANGTEVAAYQRSSPSTSSPSSSGGSPAASSSVSVKGYTRANGTEVAGYQRSSPSSSKSSPSSSKSSPSSSGSGSKGSSGSRGGGGGSRGGGGGGSRGGGGKK